MRRGIIFYDVAIKTCAIVMSFLASTMLLQGCGVNPAALIASVGNPAMLANLDLGFRVKGAPSGEVERFIFYAKATNAMSEKVMAMQETCVDELAAIFDLTGSEKTAEQLADFLSTVDAKTLTPSQKEYMTDYQPKVNGLAIVGTTAGLSAINLVLAAKPAWNKIQEDPIKAAMKGPAIVGAFTDVTAVVEVLGPAFEGFDKLSVSFNNLSNAAGIAKLSPAEERIASTEALKSVEPDASFS